MGPKVSCNQGLTSELRVKANSIIVRWGQKSPSFKRKQKPHPSPVGSLWVSQQSLPGWEWAAAGGPRGPSGSELDLQTRQNACDGHGLLGSVVGPVSGRELSLLLKAPSLLLFNHSSPELTVHSRKGEHAVPHSAGAPNGVRQESCHQFSLDCQVIFILR